jgi:membrane protease YdiL (CAAX protease family)
MQNLDWAKMKENIFQRHPISLYFILVFFISWGGLILAVGPKFLQGEVFDLTDIGIMAIPMLGAPFVVGILMNYLVDNKEGLKELTVRLRNWRVKFYWYGPIVIFPSLLLIVSVICSIVFSPELAPAFFVVGLFLGLFAGFFEEIGWMGFVFPQMSKNGNILYSAIILGIIHGIWHVFPDFLANFITLGEYWALYMFGFILHVVALRILIVWVYTNTNSLFLAIMMHASSSGFYGFFISTEISPESRAIVYLVYGFILWIPAIIVSYKYGKNLEK